MIDRAIGALHAAADALQEVAAASRRDWNRLSAEAVELREKLAAAREELEVERAEHAEASVALREAREALSIARLEAKSTKVQQQIARRIADERRELSTKLVEANAARDLAERAAGADRMSLVGALCEIERLCGQKLEVMEPGAVEHSRLGMFIRQVKGLAHRGQNASGDACLQRSARTSIELAAERLTRRLARHRERYLRAWVAAWGVDPRLAELVQRTDPDGTITLRARLAADARQHPLYLEQLTHASGSALDLLASAAGVERRRYDMGVVSGPGICETDVELRSRLIDTVQKGGA